MKTHGKSKSNPTKSKPASSNANLPKPPFGIRNASKTIPTSPPDDNIYRNSTNEKLQHEIVYHWFDPEQWKSWYSRYTTQPDFNPGKVCGLRCIVQIGTIDAVLKGKYYLPGGKPVHLNKKTLELAARSTKMYNSDHDFTGYGDDLVLQRQRQQPAPSSNKPRKKRGSDNNNETTTTTNATTASTTTSTATAATTATTEVLVVKGDCLEAALWAKNHKGLNNVALLNMASTSHPGGGYRSGTAAQEENLHRRTNLFQCLDDPYRCDPTRSWSYPLPEFGGIYSPNVCVFRRSEDNGYAFLEQPDYISIISVAAYSCPPTETNAKGELVLSGKIATHTKRKIATILNIALDNGHDSLVLSAFGCGAYRNPPRHMAELFKEVLHSPRFRNKFACVIFAILDHAAPAWRTAAARVENDEEEGEEDTGEEEEEGLGRNLTAFAEVFKCEPLNLADLLPRHVDELNQ